ncbi:hypothetical protein R1flu_006211 [Riccia fluitans]|uniref:Uncharacterized protein n=1 Tax=Riccia fluitans TaxID=41844 RepID=A0ABD1YZF4_9MARC
MDMKRILIVVHVVVLSVWSSSIGNNLLGAEARPLLLERAGAFDLKEIADWLRREAKHAVDVVQDFGVGEDRVDEIVAAAEKRQRVSALPKVVQKPADGQLDEIDRLKLSINKILCESMEEGCDHMEDAEALSAEGSLETFASLKPEDYVRSDA